MNLKACRKEKGLRETVEIGGEEGGREVEGERWRWREGERRRWRRRICSQLTLKADLGAIQWCDGCLGNRPSHCPSAEGGHRAGRVGRGGHPVGGEALVGVAPQTLVSA